MEFSLKWWKYSKVLLCFEGRSSSYLLAWCCCYQTSWEYEHTKHQNWVEFHWWRSQQSQRRRRWSSPSLPRDNNVDETWQTLDWNLSELKEEENYFYVSHQQRMWDVSRKKNKNSNMSWSRHEYNKLFWVLFEKEHCICLLQIC